MTTALKERPVFNSIKSLLAASLCGLTLSALPQAMWAKTSLYYPINPVHPVKKVFIVMFQHGKSGKASKPARTTGKTPAKPAAPQDPPGRDGAVVAATRTFMTQLLAGKVNPALMTPTMRAKFTPAKAKTMGASLKEYGALKSVKLVSRKEGDVADVCTLRILLGQTSFIGTVAVTKDNKIDDLQLLEE
jgi:hypothetical protein